MQTLKWTETSRKRDNSLSHDHPDYVPGYDLDMADFTELTATYNERALSRQEEDRLHLYVMTLMNIVLENPKLNPRREELDQLTDAMYIDGWGSLRYIHDGKKPYSYVYRSMFTAACRFFKRKIKEREKEEAIRTHCAEAYDEWLDEVGDHKVRVADCD